MNDYGVLYARFIICGILVRSHSFWRIISFLNFLRFKESANEFRICVRSNNYDELACGTGYNSEAKPEHIFINLFVEENRNPSNGDIDSQAQSQSQDNEQSQSQSQNNEQTTTIINRPPNSRCVIEQ